MQSTADMLECSCKRNNEKEIFICLEKKCPNNQSLPHYCITCSQDPGKHAHQGILIITEINRINNNWTDVRKGIDEICV